MDRNVSNESVRWSGFMDIAKVISNLRRELELVNQAIHSLEPLMPSRRGRPRKGTSPHLRQPGVPDSVPKDSGKRTSGNALAVSAGDFVREPGVESARKGAKGD